MTTRTSARYSAASGILLVAGGVIATAWAGRNLAITLTAASANAWRIPRPGGMTSPRAVGVVIALLSAVLVFAGVLRLIHDSPHRRLRRYQWIRQLLEDTRDR